MDERALWKLSYGLYVVASRHDGRPNGQIANTVFQLTAEPSRVAACINKDNLTHEFIEKSRRFTVNVLHEEVPMELIGRFGFRSGRKEDKFSGVKWKELESGSPCLLEGSCACLEIEVEGTCDVGTHTLFWGTVVDALLLEDIPPLTYAQYHARKGAKSHPRSPTFTAASIDPPAAAGRAEAREEGKEKGMKKYVCDVCGYVYDPEKGEPSNGVAPGTSFEDLPDDWVCPLCGAGKDDFSPQD